MLLLAGVCGGSCDLCVLLLFNLLLFGDVCVVNSVACSLVPFVWVAVFVC